MTKLKNQDYEGKSVQERGKPARNRTGRKKYKWQRFEGKTQRKTNEGKDCKVRGCVGKNSKERRCEGNSGLESKGNN